MGFYFSPRLFCIIGAEFVCNVNYQKYFFINMYKHINFVNRSLFFRNYHLIFAPKKYFHFGGAVQKFAFGYKFYTYINSL
jgi:hypothetical protein